MMTTAEKRLKELETFLKDAGAFILWATNHDKRDIIIPTLAHDIGGLVNHDECFNPRVTGFATR